MSSLSETLQEKAKNELGEKVEWRDRDIQALRDLLKSDLALHCPLEDDNFLLMFLRARKFDYENAAKLVRRYYEVRIEYPDFYKKYRPSFAKENYEKGMYLKLPKSKETDPVPLLVRLALWDPSTAGIDDVIRANIMQVEKVIRSEEVQVNGIVMLMDVNQLTWAHAKSMNPFVAKRTMAILQHAMPCRVKGIHYVNVPHFFEYVFAMVKQFMSDKLKSRIHIHSSPEYLKEHFSLDVLPESLGGTLVTEPYVKSWAEEMANSEDEFISRERYGIKRVETVADNSHKQADAAGGITGTFKKLNCD